MRPMPQARPRAGLVPQHLAHAAGARPRVATVPKSPNLITNSRCFNKRKVTVVETNSDNGRVKAAQSGVGGKGLSLTKPEPFKLKTEIRAVERVAFERMRRLKETAAEDEKLLEEEKKHREEQDDLLKVRKSLVHKAQPVRNYKPIAIKKSDKKVTLPSSPHLGVVFRGSGM